MSTADVSAVRKPLAERLMHEALAIVREDGPDSLSLREVQRRAGVSPAAAYRHFRDRNALLLAIAQESAGLLADSIARSMDSAPVPAAGASAARARLFAACEGYLDFATGNPGLYRAIFVSDEQIDELTAPSERARGSVGDGGYNLLISALEGVVAETGGTEVNPWDPLVVWSACHGLAMLRNDAALRFLPADYFAQARERVLQTITAAVPLDIRHAPGPQPPRARSTGTGRPRRVR